MLAHELPDLDLLFSEHVLHVVDFDGAILWSIERADRTTVQVKDATGSSAFLTDPSADLDMVRRRPRWRPWWRPWTP